MGVMLLLPLEEDAAMRDVVLVLVLVLLMVVLLVLLLLLLSSVFSAAAAEERERFPFNGFVSDLILTGRAAVASEQGFYSVGKIENI